MRNRSLKDDIRDYWAERSQSYDASPGHGLGPRRTDWQALLSRHLGPAEGRQALDLGCGTGEITLLLQGLGFATTGLDMTPQMLDRARSKARDLPVRFIEADAALTMLPDASTDVIVARYLFWTLTDPEVALADWHCILRPGGTLLLVDGDHVTSPPLARLGALLDRMLGKDPDAAHALVTAAQWRNHASIVARLPFRNGLRLRDLSSRLEGAGFSLARRDHPPLGDARPGLAPAAAPPWHASLRDLGPAEGLRITRTQKRCRRSRRGRSGARVHETMAHNGARAQVRVKRECGAP